MTAMRTTVWAYILAMGVSGCGVHSVEPLGPKGAMFADEQLVGVWRLRTDDGQPAATYLHIGRDGSNERSLSCLTVHRSGSGNVRPAKNASIATTVIGDSRIANINYDTANDMEHYTFARYVVEDDRLQLFLMNPRIVRRAVEAGELDGKMKSHRYVRLSADQTDLVNFVASIDHEELFGATTRLVFERVEPPLTISDR